MALMLLNFDLDNYAEWKQVFDSDPVGRKAVATGHRILRSVDNPNVIFVAIEYKSTDEAKAFRDRLLQSGVLDRFPLQAGPTVVETDEEITY